MDSATEQYSVDVSKASSRGSWVAGFTGTILTNHCMPGAAPTRYRAGRLPESTRRYNLSASLRCDPETQTDVFAGLPGSRTGLTPALTRKE